MNDERKQDGLAAAAVIMMLILTAFGNAWVMLVAAAVALVVGGVLFRRGRLSRQAALIAGIGVVVGALAVGAVQFLVRR